LFGKKDVYAHDLYENSEASIEAVIRLIHYIDENFLKRDVVG